MLKEYYQDKFGKGMISWEVHDDESLANYTLWQMQLIVPHLGKRVLEVGAGWGRFTSLLNTKLNFEKYVAIEPSKQIYDVLRKKCPGVETLNTTIEKLGYEFNNTFDTVFLVHVLEHIENDEKFLKELDRFLIPGGKMIIMVPAMDFLFSDLDRNIGHYRRYNKKRINFLAGCIGYDVIFNQYNNFIGIIGWLWYCKIRKVHYQAKKEKKILLNRFRIYDKYFMPVISRVEKYFSLPFGLNLTVVLRKPINNK